MRPDAVVLRPSVLFGPGDGFFNRFATLARMLPVLPLAGAETKFQPVFAGDVGEAIGRAIDGSVAGGRIYELGGPMTQSLEDLVRYVLEVTGRKRMLVSLPWNIARMQGSVIGTLNRFSLGLMPDAFVVTRDQITLLERDNVVSKEAIAREAHPRRARHRADGIRGDGAVISRALPQDRTVRPQAQHAAGEAAEVPTPVLIPPQAAGAVRARSCGAWKAACAHAPSAPRRRAA